ncbi:hypothetical protein ISN45_At05g027770 [Arabidopsis thaliana x Arabidopsis arenosa]|uniref:Uncharacterized protein n=1 Tax=Arabidopsis thaliana x Arabidopsis arenosa TaxID=1240361 RepID=A0A8T2CWJ9_9BRAS|nr:hypothetical protein ISN45_At05g027770 [Arabidopsis thaliana x Arabidopsis arenosa]
MMKSRSPLLDQGVEWSLEVLKLLLDLGVEWFDMIRDTGSLGKHRATSVATGLQGTRVPPTTLQILLSRRPFLKEAFTGPMVIQLTKPPSPPPSAETRMESMLEQILESQTKLVVEFNGKFDAVYTDLNGKIDNLSSHLKKLDVQPELVYTPPVPYPKRRRSKQELHAAKCKAIMEKIFHTLPKDASETSASSLNRPTRITLLFADRSKRIPEGILEDVHVKVGNSVIPADFVVLDYEKEPKDPLILGRAFLATTGARFDVKKERISLKIHLLRLIRIPPQSHTKRSNPLSSPMRVAEQRCRSILLPPVDRYPRVLQTEDSAHSLQPTPLKDLCDKFSSLSSPALPLINSLDNSKIASQDNKPRVPRKLVSPVVLAGDEMSVDRHIPDCRSKPAAAPARSLYTPP